jgi:hypothetical protein
MNHRKCGGRVFIDRVYSEKSHLELSCLECGARWMLDKTKNKLAAYLIEKEKVYALQFAR